MYDEYRICDGYYKLSQHELPYVNFVSMNYTSLNHEDWYGFGKYFNFAGKYIYNIYTYMKGNYYTFLAPLFGAAIGYLSPTIYTFISGHKIMSSATINAIAAVGLFKLKQYYIRNNELKNLPADAYKILQAAQKNKEIAYNDYYHACQYIHSQPEEEAKQLFKDICTQDPLSIKMDHYVTTDKDFLDSNNTT